MSTDTTDTFQRLWTEEFTRGGLPRDKATIALRDYLFKKSGLEAPQIVQLFELMKPVCHAFYCAGVWSAVTGKHVAPGDTENPIAVWVALASMPMPKRTENGPQLNDWAQAIAFWHEQFLKPAVQSVIAPTDKPATPSEKETQY